MLLKACKDVILNEAKERLRFFADAQNDRADGTTQGSTSLTVGIKECFYDLSEMQSHFKRK